MGNNTEIRQRLETYRNILLLLSWICSIALIIVGFYLTNLIGGYAFIIIIVAIILGIISHFMVNVALAIPFILLNNGDYLAAIVPEGKLNQNSNMNNSNLVIEKINKTTEFEIKYLREIEDEKEILKSELYNLEYDVLMDKLLYKYPVSTRRDIEHIENKHGIETAKKIIVKMLLK